MHEQVSKIAASSNPTFDTVTGLTNRTFDPANVASGRGATEDQLLVLHQQCAALEAQLETIENSETMTAIIAEMRAEVDDLRTMIEHCCYTLVSGNAEWGGDGDGADITINITWDADPLTNGGQMTAVSSGGAAIVRYYFLVQKGDGIFLKMKAANYAGNIVAVDTETGAITVTAGSGTGTDKIIAGATDAHGCEGVQAFSATAAPWHVPPTTGG